MDIQLILEDVMESKNYLVNSNSILYRYTQKFYDKQLEKFQMGAGQLQFLLLIYENEGISMQNFAYNCIFNLSFSFHIGTV